MKRVALDIGNVLVKVDVSEFLGLLSSSFSISMDEAERFINRFQPAHDLGLTTIRDEVDGRFQHHWLTDELPNDIMECWDRCLTLNTSMIRMLDKVKREKGLEVALLSNIGLEHAKLVHEMLSYDECGFSFDYKHFSCEVGARKPTKLFYQSFLMQHPEFQGCLYIDDLQENLDTADELGFSVIKFSLQEENVGHRIYDLGKIIGEEESLEFWEVFWE